MKKIYAVSIAIICGCFFGGCCAWAASLLMPKSVDAQCVSLYLESGDLSVDCDPDTNYGVAVLSGALVSAVESDPGPPPYNNAPQFVGICLGP